jgi:hypothetical protein
MESHAYKQNNEWQLRMVTAGDILGNKGLSMR